MFYDKIQLTYPPSPSEPTTTFPGRRPFTNLNNTINNTPLFPARPMPFPEKLKKRKTASIKILFPSYKRPRLKLMNSFQA